MRTLGAGGGAVPRDLLLPSSPSQSRARGEHSLMVVCQLHLCSVMVHQPTTCGKGKHVGIRADTLVTVGNFVLRRTELIRNVWKKESVWKQQINSQFKAKEHYLKLRVLFFICNQGLGHLAGGRHAF